MRESCHFDGRMHSTTRYVSKFRSFYTFPAKLSVKLSLSLTEYNKKVELWESGEVKNHPSSNNNYADDVPYYDYPMGFVYRQRTNTPRNQVNQETQIQVRQQQQQQQQNLPRISALQREQQERQEQQHQSMTPTGNNNEPTLVTVFNGLKIMWDVYQAFSAAWNSVAEHQQKQENGLRENLKRQRQQQQQQRTRTRINSKKPPKFNNNATAIEAIDADVDDDEDKNDKSVTNVNKKSNNNNIKIRTTKAPKLKSTTKSEIATSLSPTKIPMEKVEPRTGQKGERTSKLAVWGSREKRTTNGDYATDRTSVGEGRYIKGDPLKGYYDFVITEGSYKFWAVFQTGTALLIIYSVFAAIYYSRVNPLVSDYDYTDYLGGGRSLSGGDLDFVDNEDDHTKTSAGWFTGVVPQATHSLKFILDALDKFPVDHGADASNNDSKTAESYNEYKSEEEHSPITTFPT